MESRDGNIGLISRWMVEIRSRAKEMCRNSIGDAMAIRLGDRSTMEIRVLKGMCRNEGVGLESIKWYIVHPQNCKKFSQISCN